MSNTETTLSPTGWFLRSDDEGGYMAAARFYAPSSIDVDVYNAQTGDWTPFSGSTNLFERLQTEPDWEQVSEQDAEAWIASKRGGVAPGSIG
jgi:hypothetical protein